MGNNIKDIQQIKSLIAKGKEMGFLTFEEVNKAVPLEMNTPEQFEEIIGIFDQLEIAIVDLEKDGKKIVKFFIAGVIRIFLSAFHTYVEGRSCPMVAVGNI